MFDTIAVVPYYVCMPNVEVASSVRCDFESSSKECANEEDHSTKMFVLSVFMSLLLLSILGVVIILCLRKQNKAVEDSEADDETTPLSRKTKIQIDSQKDSSNNIHQAAIVTHESAPATSETICGRDDNDDSQKLLSSMQKQTEVVLVESNNEKDVHQTTTMVHFPSPVKSITVGELSGDYNSRSFSSSMEVRNDARLNDSKMEEANTGNNLESSQRKIDIDVAEFVMDIVKKTFERFPQVCEKLPDIGSRLQKYWFFRRGESKMLQYLVKISAKCLMKLDDEGEVLALNDLLCNLKHPHLLPIYGMEIQDGYISILQKYVPQGSLRDIQQLNANPILDWEKKYIVGITPQPKPPSEVIVCGRNILEAVMALYKIGFPVIGQIHTGNVFKIEENYVLGGYENTLLGYKTSLDEMIAKEELQAMIDVLMFGRMIYELSTGRSLNGVMPSKDDKFEEIENEAVREFVKDIFAIKWKESYIKTMNQILNHKVFKNKVFDIKSTPLEISPEAEQLLVSINPSHFKTPVKHPTPIKGWDVKLVTTTLSKDYGDIQPLRQIGKRKDKAWAIAQHGTLGSGLLYAMTVPPTCPIRIKKRMAALQTIFKTIGNHSNLHTIKDILCGCIAETHVVLVFQEKRKESLKDFIHHCDPMVEWAGKYLTPQPLDRELICLYGYKILEAMIILKKLGFPALRHVKTGNIFIDGRNCFLGGLENTLLGYSSNNIQGFGKSINAIMFGHVMYEMSSGIELQHQIPHVDDYSDVPEVMRDILRFIFQLNKHRTQLVNSLDKILAHPFFLPHKTNLSSNVDVHLSETEKKLLKKVQNNKSKNQDERPTGLIMKALRPHQ